MSNGKKTVVVIGASLVDLVLHPIPTDLLERDSYSVEAMPMTVGGDALNEATLISRLGHQVRLVSYLGTDSVGSYILKHCQENHIDTSYVTIDPLAVTSTNVGLVLENGERIYISNRSGTTWRFDLSKVALSCLENADILSFASIFNSPLFDNAAMCQLFSHAQALGLTIFADTISSRFNEIASDIADALSYLDYFLPNKDEALKLTGTKTVEDAAKALLQYGIRTVVIKNGRKGCYIATQDGIILQIPAYPYAKAVDSTGCGDTFVSGFISALLQGCDLKTCGQFANAAASLTVEKLGATAGLLSASQAEERYQLYLQSMEG